MKLTTTLALLVGCAGTALADSTVDDFQREGDDRRAKDAMEGMPAPDLMVNGWMNTEDGGLDLASLRGKVVVIDFWGTW